MRSTRTGEPSSGGAVGKWHLHHQIRTDRVPSPACVTPAREIVKEDHRILSSRLESIRVVRGITARVTGSENEDESGTGLVSWDKIPWSGLTGTF